MDKKSLVKYHIKKTINAKSKTLNIKNFRMLSQFSRVLNRGHVSMLLLYIPFYTFYQTPFFAVICGIHLRYPLLTYVWFNRYVQSMVAVNVRYNDVTTLIEMLFTQNTVPCTQHLAFNTCLQTFQLLVSITCKKQANCSVTPN